MRVLEQGGPAQPGAAHGNAEVVCDGGADDREGVRLRQGAALRHPLGPGQEGHVLPAFGGMEFIMELDSYMTTLRAVTDCTLVKLPRPQFEKWMYADA